MVVVSSPREQMVLGLRSGDRLILVNHQIIKVDNGVTLIQHAESFSFSAVEDSLKVDFVFAGLWEKKD